MQQLKPASFALGVWRLLAILSSVSALTLGLCPHHEKLPALTPQTSAKEPPEAMPVLAEVTSAPPSPAHRDDGRTASLEALIAAAQQDDPESRSAALESIAQMGGDRARGFLARRFDAASDAELSELASALATLGDAPARAILLAAARSARPATRSATFEALSTLDSADVREFMVQALDFLDPSPAASYFSNCREPRALPGLERMARQGDADQRRVAIEALYAQGPYAEDTILRLARADDELCDALLEGQPHTTAARHALRRASIARLHEGALSSGSVFQFLERDLSGEAREALVRAARDPGSRDSALSSLSARGDNDSLRALSTLSNDVERGLAERAACALLSHPDSRWRPFLLRANRARLLDATAAALERINAPRGRAI